MGNGKFQDHYVFFIYINDLSDNLGSNVKLFVEDTLMFLVVNEPVTTSEKLNKDIDNIGLWASQWKMSFNLDPSKEA